MILSNDVYNEVKNRSATVLALASNIVVTKATKFIRHDWKSLVEYFEKNATDGLRSPFCLIRIGPSEPVELEMASQYFTIPMEIFLVRNKEDCIKTTVLLGAIGTTQQVASTIKMFVDQVLFFQGEANPVRIVSIVNGTDITITPGITTVTGETCRSDITEDVEVQIEKLRDEFRTGKTFTTFLIEEDPEQDLSDMNPVNEYYGSDNLPFFGGSVLIKPMVGSSAIP